MQDIDHTLVAQDDRVHFLKEGITSTCLAWCNYPIQGISDEIILRDAMAKDPLCGISAHRE
jgi:hypothetical protein